MHRNIQLIITQLSTYLHNYDKLSLRSVTGDNYQIILQRILNRIEQRKALAYETLNTLLKTSKYFRIHRKMI